MKRCKMILTVLLAAILMASCNSVENAETETAAEGQKESVPETEAETKAHDDLPETDMNGGIFNILVRQEKAYEFVAEQTGEVVSDAVFNRDLSLEERFNASIEYIQAPGLWNSTASYQGLITNSVMANDSSYDIVTGQSNIVLPLATNGMYRNLGDSDYIDYSKPYWKDGYLQNARIFGNLYAVVGDYALTTVTDTNCLFFNTKVMDDFSIAYPYDLVRDGKWTMDAFLSMIEQVSVDLDGNGTMDDTDQFGLMIDGHGLNSFQYGFGCSLTTPNAEGIHAVDFPSDQDVTIYETVNEMTKAPYFLLSSDIKTEGYSDVSAFASDKILFMGARLVKVEELRDMEADFGIIPNPKYDEAQKEYRSSVMRTVTVAALPTTTSRYEESEMILEAMASEGYNSIIPAYYEVTLKGKYSRDTDTADMLDIVTGSAYIAFADVFYTELGACSDMMTSFINSNQGIVSFFASKKAGIENNLESLYKTYSELN